MLYIHTYIIYNMIYAYITLVFCVMWYEWPNSWEWGVCIADFRSPIPWGHRRDRQVTDIWDLHQKAKQEQNIYQKIRWVQHNKDVLSAIPCGKLYWCMTQGGACSVNVLVDSNRENPCHVTLDSSTHPGLINLLRVQSSVRLWCVAIHEKNL